MTRRLLGPIGGPIIFLLVAGLVFAGLGWVTVASLRLEQAQQEAAAQAKVSHKLRVALYRIDTRMYLPLFVEDSRPFHHYASPDVILDYGPAPTPLLAAEFSDWMQLHFQLSQEVGWDSPQVLPSEVVATLRQRWPGLPLRNVTPDRIGLLATLRAKYPPTQAIEVFAARERAIPANSDPLAIPIFINNIDPSGAPLPPPSPVVDGPETAPTPSDLINAMPPTVPLPEVEGASRTDPSAGTTASLQDEAVVNGYAGQPSKKPAPAVQLQVEPQPAPSAADNNQLRRNSRFAEGAPGGEYPLRAQSLGRGMHDAKKAYTFPNQNPIYGGVGPLALGNFEKPPGTPVMPAPSAPGLSFGVPEAPATAGAGGLRGGVSGGSLPATRAMPSAGAVPPGLVPPPPPGAYSFVPGAGSGSAGTPPPPARPFDDTSRNKFENGKELEGTDRLAKGANDFESSLDKSLDRKDAPAESGGFRKESAESLEAPKDAAKPTAEFFSDAPKNRGLFGSLKEAIRAKESEEKLTERRKALMAGKAGPKNAPPGPTARSPVPPASPPAPAGGVAATPGGPIASALLRPNAEKTMPDLPRGTGNLPLAPNDPSLGRPAAGTSPAPAKPSSVTKPDIHPNRNEEKPSEPITPTPDPAPPAVLEPAPSEPIATHSPTPAVAVHLGSMRPQWLTAADGTEILVFVRAARLENKTVYQGVALDWSKLQTVLKEEVQDLFPEAKLVPVKDPTGVPRERAMTALPVQLDPGPAPEPEPVGWTPLRFGLVLAWAAAVIAFVAVGLCGWSLIDLSERRIRFVSAVTHELRTPLTALRLYLDLLLSGMVQDEEKRREYLATLNAESDRLHRLIDNVLDFARIERQRKRSLIQTMKVTELLDQVRSTWTDRCGSDQKQLIVTSALPPESEISTDPILVQQIVGNLIDNARKYTRDADDSRIWVSAKPGGRNRIFIEVEDRGSGIPPRERAVIFRPFRRGESADTKAGGAGLGLALSKQWADVLGGRLTCHPADGGTGSCFRLELRVK